MNSISVNLGLRSVCLAFYRGTSVLAPCGINVAVRFNINISCDIFMVMSIREILLQGLVYTGAPNHTLEEDNEALVVLLLAQGLLRFSGSGRLSTASTSATLGGGRTH